MRNRLRPVRLLRRVWLRLTNLSRRLVVYLACETIVLAAGVIVLHNAKHSTLQAIGTSLVAAAAAGYALFAYVLISEGWTRRVEDLLNAGFRQWWAGRSVTMKPEYDSRLNDAREAIDILGFGQQHFRDDQHQNFRRWSAAGIRVRILLIDPGYPNDARSFAGQRETEEAVPAGSIATDVDAFLREVSRQGLGGDAHFTVRLYSCLPTLSIFRIDDELFWGPYLVREVSRNTPTFLIARGLLFTRLMRHFDTIWTDAGLSREVDWARYA